MRARQSAIWFVFAFAALAVSFGCTTPWPTDRVSASVACIEGAVSYMSPTSPAKMPYPYATVTAWDHGKNQALVESKADKDGNYCIEVPLGSGRMDLRVWGLERFERADYICEGSVSNIDPGSIPTKCGGGECLKVNINTECRERVEPRRGG